MLPPTSVKTSFVVRFFLMILLQFSYVNLAFLMFLVIFNILNDISYGGHSQIQHYVHEKNGKAF